MKDIIFDVTFDRHNFECITSDIENCNLVEQARDENLELWVNPENCHLFIKGLRLVDFTINEWFNDELTIFFDEDQNARWDTMVKPEKIEIRFS